MRIDDDLRQHAQDQDLDIATTLEQINRLITALLAFGGLASESITRTHAWRFLQLGRRIERAWQTAELLSATLGDVIAEERILLESVLRASDSLMTYRVRYLLQLQPAAVIDLLITDETNPRSIGFQVQQIDDLIGGLPTDEDFVGLGQDERLAKSLRHEVQMSDAFRLAHADEHGSRNELKVLLQKMTTELPQLSDAIAARYLIHTGGAQTLTGRLDSSLEPEI